MKYDREFLDTFAEGAIILEGFDEAIIGIVETMGSGPRILYSVEKILEVLMKDDMTEEDAMEYYDFNILNLWVSEQNPVFLTM